MRRFTCTRGPGRCTRCPSRRWRCSSGMKWRITPACVTAAKPQAARRMTMTPTACDRPLTDRALDVLRQAGNPFRNYFARNPDDEVCARFHVAELYARERGQLLGVVELYRAAAAPPS